MKIGGYQGKLSVHTRALRMFADDLALAFERAVHFEPDVTALPGGTAGALFADVETGRNGWRACYLASGYLAAKVPDLALLDLPFSAPDRDVLFARLSGVAGRRLSEAVAARTGLHVLGLWDNGVRHITNRHRPILSPHDCHELKIRTLDSPIYRDALAAFGFTPVVTDVAELRHAVASGLVDAQENPLTNTYRFGLHDHHRYLSLTGHFSGVALFVCHADWLNGLAALERDAIEAAADRATAAQRVWAADDEASALCAMNSAGVSIAKPDDLDLAGFRALSEPVILEWRRKISADLQTAWFG